MTYHEMVMQMNGNMMAVQFFAAVFLLHWLDP